MHTVMKKAWHRDQCSLQSTGFALDGLSGAVKLCRRWEWRTNANDQSVSQKRSPAGAREDQESRTQVLSSEAWRMSSCLYLNTKKAELGAAKSGACPVNEWDGSYNLHPWCRAQSPGALHRAHTWWPCEGLAGCPLSHHQRCPRCRRCGGSKAEPFEVWSEASQVEIFPPLVSREWMTHAKN